MRKQLVLAFALPAAAACSRAPDAILDGVRPGLWEYEGFISSIEGPIGAQPRMRDQLPEHMRRSRTLRGCVTELEIRDFLGQARVSGFIHQGQIDRLQIRDQAFSGGVIRARASWDIPQDSAGEARVEGRFTETTLEARIITEERRGPPTAQPDRIIFEVRGHRLGECPGNGR